LAGWGAGTKLSRLKLFTLARKMEFTGFRERVQEEKNTVKKNTKRAARPGKKAGKRAKRGKDPVSG
jgi:hypothetical protein